MSISLSHPNPNGFSSAKIKSILKAKYLVMICTEEDDRWVVWEMSKGFLVTDQEDYYYWVETEEEATTLWCQHQTDPLWKEVANGVVKVLALHHLPNWG
tara:strand:- start:1498 stop:1794 length:297 start_codon:yes stop_codon:yes gene_type:complete